ncbi:MAG: SH3 domain-containing protein, partial [Gammaproteobacteria bacterium]
MPGLRWELADLMGKYLDSLNDPIIEYKLGMYYELGYGTDIDKKQANAFYQGAFKQREVIKQRADAGDAEAQFVKARILANGQANVKKDPKQAVIWYRKAADKGLAAAQNDLGVMYLEGNGVDKDYIQAKDCLLKAANQDYAEAQYNIGYMYENNLVCSVNAREMNDLSYQVQAGFWYYKAAELDHGKGIAGLKRLRTLIPDLDKKIKALNQPQVISTIQKREKEDSKTINNAAKPQLLRALYSFKAEKATDLSFNKDDILELLMDKGNWLRCRVNNAEGLVPKNYVEYCNDSSLKQTMNKNNDAVENPNKASGANPKLSSSPLQEEFQQTFQAAQSNLDPLIHYYLGWMYMSGTGVCADNQQAQFWFARALNQLEIIKQRAGQDEAQAQFVWGRIIYNGQAGLTKERSKALDLYRKSAEQDYVRAQYNLALEYLDETTGLKDAQQALLWFHKAASQGDAWAYYQIGMLHYFGGLIAKNEAEGLKWFHKAALQGLSAAQTMLGKAFLLGKGVKEDFIQARLWLTKAVEQEEACGEYYLGSMYEQGKGVAKDPVQAMVFYRKAARHGDQNAVSRINQFFVPREMQNKINFIEKSEFLKIQDQTPTNGLKEKFQLVFNFAQKTNDPLMHYELGRMYEIGLGIQANPNKADFWYKKAFSRIAMIKRQAELEKSHEAQF